MAAPLGEAVQVVFDFAEYAFHWTKILAQQVGKSAIDFVKKRAAVDTNYHHAGFGIFLSTTALEREIYM